MAWPINPRPAKSLVTLRGQYNAKYPGRGKESDGMLGDAAHQARLSDHNPNAHGVVTALDITHDPAHGLDIKVEVERLVASKDPRIKYLIANKRIWEPSKGWQPFKGESPHTKHMHISVNVHNADDPRKWDIEEEDMAVITTEAVVALSIATTGKQPSNAEERYYINKPATQENLDGLITYWASKSRIRPLEKALVSSNTNAQAKLDEIKKSLGV